MPPLPPLNQENKWIHPACKCFISFCHHVQVLPPQLWWRWAIVMVNRQIIKLTCYFQRCIPANRFSQVVSRHADINPLVWFTSSSMDNAEEEEGTTRQQHAVRTRVVLVRLHPFTIFVPFDNGSGTTFCFAVQRCRFPLRNYVIRWMFYYSWWEILQTGTRAWTIQKKKKSIYTVRVSQKKTKQLYTHSGPQVLRHRKPWHFFP